MDNLQALAAHFSDIRVLLLFYWVESSFIAYTGLSLLGIRINLKKAVTIGVFHGLGVFIVRGLYNLLGLTFGTHSLILLLLMAFLIYTVVNLRFGISLTAALLGVVLLLIGELVTMPYFYRLMDMPVEEIWGNPWTHIMAGYVGDLLIIITALVTTIFNVSLLRLRD